MKVFKITTEVQATKTLEYTVEANSMEEAIQIVCGGEERGEGEEVEEQQLAIMKASLEDRKKEHKADPTDDSKRHSVSVLQSVVNHLKKELWKYE